MRYEIITLSNDDPYRCLAVEERLFDTLPVDCSRIIFYVNNPCVVFGKHQVCWREANVRYLADHHIAAVRRISGGGTVFHDHGNLNYAYITQKDLYNRDAVLSAVTRGLASLGISAFIKDGLDIATTMGKISGNAFSFRRGRALHHGTVLVHADLGHMSESLKGLDAITTTRAVDSRKTKVINLDTINPGIRVDEVRDALAQSFAEMSVQWSGGDSQVTRSDYESREGEDPAIDSLAERNRSWDWVYGRSPDFTIFCGTFGADRLELHLHRGRIVGTSGFGSHAGDLTGRLVGLPFQANALGAVFGRLARIRQYDLYPLLDYLS